MNRLALKFAVAQSDLDMAGFNITNCPSLGGGGGAGTAPWYNVKDHGAVGDGTTNDTGAIQATLAAVIAAGGGVLYFPAGNYLYTGTTLIFSKPVVVQGDGGGQWRDGINAPIDIHGNHPLSKITFPSTTGTLFQIGTDPTDPAQWVYNCGFRDINLYCPYSSGSTVPTAGAAIKCFYTAQTMFLNLTINGFYVGIDMLGGELCQFHYVSIVSPVLYGIRIQNPLNPDFGEHFFSNCYFMNGGAPPSGDRNAAAGLRIEAGGGIKINSCKWVAAYNTLWGVGVDLAVANSCQTVDLLITNCSIESFSSAGIRCRSGTSSSSWKNIIIHGNQISPWDHGGSANGIDINGTNAADLQQISIVGNNGMNTPATNGAFIALDKCQEVSVVGNHCNNFTLGLLTATGNTTFARSATVPRGGTTAQLLKKLSNADYDMGWVAGGTFTPQAGWTAPTGTDLRTGYATSTATLTQVAQTLKSLVADLITAGVLTP